MNLLTVKKACFHASSPWEWVNCASLWRELENEYFTPDILYFFSEKCYAAGSGDEQAQKFFKKCLQNSIASNYIMFKCFKDDYFDFNCISPCQERNCPMRATGKKYPSYSPPDEKILSTKVLISLDYEQILEIANLLVFLHSVSSFILRFLGCFVSPAKKALHKSTHDALINCALSLEELSRVQSEGKQSS
jgi:hypothetical protein